MKVINHDSTSHGCFCRKTAIKAASCRRTTCWVDVKGIYRKVTVKVMRNESLEAQREVRSETIKKSK